MAPAGFGGRVEGVHAVGAALAAGRLRTLTVEQGRGDRGAAAPIVDEARAAGLEITVVESIWDHAETDAPQGLVGTAQPIRFTPLADLAGPGAAIVVLDHLEDPRNVGAVARSALAAGMTGLVIPERRAAPITAVSISRRW